eukprot:g14300.t1
MTAAAVQQDTGQTPRDILPLPETEQPSQSSTPMEHAWGCHPAMPRLSEVVPGWNLDSENHNQIDVEGGGGIGKGVERDSGRIPPHRRKVVRTRAAPAGPHPYLDRFASGMHRPFEGEDASWRKASIQPVPIPDLGHTGIRTKFSTGAGNGFTPSGGMTETFRTGIHDTMRNLPPQALGDARDMKARDYARAVRKHRADPCGGSLLHAHMSSLELDTVGARSLTPLGGGAAGPGCLRQSSSLGTFRSRFSPPSSPLSTRRAFAGYARVRGWNNGGGCGVLGLEEGAPRGACSAPSEGRQALLRKELSGVQLAAANVAGVTNPAAGGGRSGRVGTPTIPTGARTAGEGTLMDEGSHESSRGASRPGRGEGTAKDRPQETVPTQDAEVDPGHGGEEKNGTADLARIRRNGEDNINSSVGFVGGWNSGSSDLEAGDADESAWRSNSRARGRRRARPTGTGAGSARPEDSRDGHPALQGPTSVSPLDSHSREMPRKKTRKHPCSRRHRSTASAAKPRPRHLKKPFSADSLLSCLLDVRFGNTRDLSPAKPPGQKWDLRTIPAGVTVGTASPGIAGGWDGCDESEDLGGRVGRDTGVVDPNCGSWVSSLQHGYHGGGGGEHSGFAVVCGNKELSASGNVGSAGGGAREGHN